MKNLDNYQVSQEGAIMENPQISEETREELEEATVSLFMDQYAKAMNAGFDAMMEESADNEFPPELEKRCLALIEQEYAKERNKRRRKAALRVLRSAAAVVVVVLGLCSILFMTVEAFRVPIMNFFAEKHDGHLELRGTYAESESPSVFNPDDPLGDIIPAEYTLADINSDWQKGLVTAVYCNEENSIILFSIEPSENSMLIDDEDAETLQFQLMNCDAYLLREDEMIRLVWLDSDNCKTFTICANKIQKDAVIALAEAVAIMFK